MGCASSRDTQVQEITPSEAAEGSTPQSPVLAFTEHNNQAECPVKSNQDLTVEESVDCELNFEQPSQQIRPDEDAEPGGARFLLHTGYYFHKDFSYGIFDDEGQCVYMIERQHHCFVDQQKNIVCQAQDIGLGLISRSFKITPADTSLPWGRLRHLKQRGETTYDDKHFELLIFASQDSSIEPSSASHSATVTPLPVEPTTTASDQTPGEVAAQDPVSDSLAQPPLPSAVEDETGIDNGTNKSTTQETTVPTTRPASDHGKATSMRLVARAVMATNRMRQTQHSVSNPAPICRLCFFGNCLDYQWQCRLDSEESDKVVARASLLPNSGSTSTRADNPNQVYCIDLLRPSALPLGTLPLVLESAVLIDFTVNRTKW